MEIEGKSQEMLSKVQEIKLIWQGWYPLPLSGFLITLLVSILSLTGAQGASEALDQLVHHTLEIHPLYWAICYTAVTFYIAMLGWRLKNLLKFFLVPVVSFVTHVFGLAVGAIMAIAVYKFAKVGGLNCHEYSIGTGLLLSSILFSIMGVSGAMFIRFEHRVKEPSDLVLVIFFIFSLLGVVGIYKAADINMQEAKMTATTMANRACMYSS